jgi:hypothetical protein
VEPSANATGLVEGGLLTVQEAMAFIKKSRSWLYQEMDAGRLSFAVIGRRRYIPRLALVNFIARQLTVPAGEVVV